MRLFLIVLAIMYPFNAVWAQGEGVEVGRIADGGGNKYVAEVTGSQLGVGDEVQVIRRENIVDPVSGLVRGMRTITAATCVVTDIGLNRATLEIVGTIPHSEIRRGDLVVPTGKAKESVPVKEPEPVNTNPWWMDYETRQLVISLARIDSLQEDIAPDEEQFAGARGTVSEASDSTVVTTLGSVDDISEGDIFLVRRTEPVYDPATNKVTGSNEVNVARVKVRSVADSTSVSEILEKKFDPKPLDRVILESEYLAFLKAAQSDSLPAAAKEVPADLRAELDGLHATVDSLRLLQQKQGDMFEAFRKEVIQALGELMRGDAAETRQIVRKGETAPADDLLTWYGRTLDRCLARDYDTAVRDFTAIIQAAPVSPLVENCRYWIAQSRFNTGDYSQAADLFREIITDKRFTHKDDDASVMLGLTCIRLNDRTTALDEFRRFLDAYPNSEYRARVLAWLNNLSAEPKSADQ